MKTIFPFLFSTLFFINLSMSSPEKGAKEKTRSFATIQFEAQKLLDAEFDRFLKTELRRDNFDHFLGRTFSQMDNRDAFLFTLDRINEAHQRHFLSRSRSHDLARVALYHYSFREFGIFEDDFLKGSTLSPYTRYRLMQNHHLFNLTRSKMLDCGVMIN